VHEVRIGRALVVHTQHGTTCFLFRITTLGIDVVNVHAVVVITNAAGPVIGLGASVRVSGQRRIERIACGMQHAVLVTRWQHHIVEQAFFHGRKAQRAGRRGQTRSQCGASWQHGQAGQTQATAQQTTACGILQRLREHLLEMGVVRRVVYRVKIVVGHLVAPK